MYINKPTGILSYSTRRVLRQTRRRKGWSQARLGRLLGVSAGTIRNWEANLSSPRDVYTLRAYCAHLELEPVIRLSISVRKPDPRPGPSNSQLAQRRVAGNRARDAVTGKFIVSTGDVSGD